MTAPTPKLRRRPGRNWRRLFVLKIAICFAAAPAIAISLLLIFSPLPQVKAESGRLNQASRPLPPPQIHPLPATLAKWNSTGDDYFSEVKPTPGGYLIWSQFPIKVYVEQPTDLAESSPSARRFQDWVNAVLKAVAEWNIYLPLEVVTQPTFADISIWRSRPPLQSSVNSETGQFNIPRARAAETRYELYLRPTVNSPTPALSHRFTIQLSPDQTVEYTLATARHELGHALGIWGHSALETDTMYFSQVRNPPPISARDINTLKRVYEQPTRFGWYLP